MIVEGIVICGLLCVVIDYIVKSKRRRFMSYETEAASPTKLPPSIADSGNISCSNGGSGKYWLDFDPGILKIAPKI